MKPDCAAPTMARKAQPFSMACGPIGRVTDFNSFFASTYEGVVRSLTIVFGDPGFADGQSDPDRHRPSAQPNSNHSTRMHWTAPPYSQRA